MKHKRNMFSRKLLKRREIMSLIKNYQFDKIIDIASCFATWNGAIHKDNNYTLFEILEFGDLVEANAHYHESGEYYEIIGLELKIRSHYTFHNNVFASCKWGFYPIYSESKDANAPIIFDELELLSGYNNGIGDSVQITNILLSSNEIKSQINSFDFSSYSKKL